MSKTSVYSLHYKILKNDKIINAVGINIFKGKCMIAIMYTFGEIIAIPFEIKHTSNDINSFVYQF